MACLRTLPTSLMSSVAVRTAAFMPARRSVRTGEKLEGRGTLSEEEEESRRGPVDLGIIAYLLIILYALGDFFKFGY